MLICPDLPELIEWLMPQIHEEAYVIDAASLLVRHVSRGTAVPARDSMAFDELLDARGKARLTHFLLSPASEPMTGALIDQEQWAIGPRDA